ncbi:MAG: thiamine diphosphokinase [Anaerolineae bacterium]|nr:thiamine diphosphokinase [Anaerolineae bacterium]
MADGSREVVIVANGTFAHAERLLPILEGADQIIAADGGGNWLYDQGRIPDLVVGDLDSISAEVLAAFRAHGCQLERHRPDKDETDTELALLAARDRGARRIVLLGALGGRIDHTLANILLLAMPQLAGSEVLIFDGTSFLFLAQDETLISGEVGDLVSLIPWGGAAHGIRTEGLRYPLREESLRVGPARGVSNVLVQPQARVTLEAGALLVVHTPKRYLSEDESGQRRMQTEMSETGQDYNPFAQPEVARLYDAWYETPLGARVDRLEKALIADLAEPRAGERALDVGTGTGHFACWLADMGLHVIGYDSSEAMLRVARADTRISWQQGDAEQLPFEDGAFDLVLCVTALEFMAHPQRALEEMYRVTTPGGRLVVGVLNKESRFGRAYLAQACEENTPFRHAHLYTAESFLSLIEPLDSVRWGGSVFFGPELKRLALADCYEWFGRHCFGLRQYGALLVGRIDK